VVEQWHSWLRW